MIDATRFKSGMRQLAGHVCLITAADGSGQRHGLTATAVCSVSAEPPLLLCCVNRSSGSHAAIEAAGAFAVNVLAAPDQPLAQRFASAIAPEARFAQGDWQAGASGSPLLRSALAAFDCRLVQAVEAGSHSVFIGQVLGLSLHPGVMSGPGALTDAAPDTATAPAGADGAALAPLLYAQGLFGRFEPQPT